MAHFDRGSVARLVPHAEASMQSVRIPAGITLAESDHLCLRGRQRALEGILVSADRGDCRHSRNRLVDASPLRMLDRDRPRFQLHALFQTCPGFRKHHAG